MSEVGPPNPETTDEWRAHYDSEDGPRKIEARQWVYRLAVERGGETDTYQKVDLEIEAIQALQYAGVGDEATIVDIGCSFPNFLQLWNLQGHRGRLIGIEPNTKQFKGLPYTNADKVPVIGRLDASTREDFARTGNLELYEAWAHELSLPDGVADVATMMFMMYHVPKNLQLQALQEAKRILHPETGIFALSTRSKNNKRLLRVKEKEISRVLAATAGVPVQAPPPINSGFTSEDGNKILPSVYCHVYAYRHVADILMNSRGAVRIIDEAIWSLKDKYQTAAGEAPSDDEFYEAVKLVLGKDYQLASLGRTALKDIMDETLYIASDRSLNLPKKFKKLR